MFSPDQINQILETIRKNNLIYFASTVSPKPLSQKDYDLLKKHGVDINKIKTDFSPFEQAYYFGRLSQVLGDENTKTLNYTDLLKYLRKGQFNPLTEVDRNMLDLAENRIYNNITWISNKQEGEVRTIIDEESHKVIQQEMKQGIKTKDSIANIANNISKRLNDWSKDMDRVVETEYNNIFLEGRAREIANRHGIDAKVYKQIFAGVCRHCIKAYTTSGYGSKPREFKLSDLIQNGSNVGKKVGAWVSTLSSMHPHSITDKATSILSDKGWKSIYDINEGDLVLTHKGRFRKVISTLKDYPCSNTDNKYTYLIYYKHPYNKDPDDLVKLSFTGDHKVLTQNGWKMVKDLSINDKLLKLMKKCVVCDNYIESYNNEHKSCCCESCTKKYRAQNAHKQWGNYSKDELKELKFKISEKVKDNWENGLHENTLNSLKSEKRIEDSRQRMLNGGAVIAMNGQNGKMTSKIQSKLYEMVLRIFPTAQLEYKIFNKSLDIAIPEFKIDIEFDGVYWHKEREEYDKKRDNLLKNNGWHVLRYSKLPKVGILRNDIETIIQNDKHQYKFIETDIIFIKRNFTNNKTFLYDLEVEEDASFIARGVVVHNCRCLLRQVPLHSEWDEETGEYKMQKYDSSKSKVIGKIKITVNDKVFIV